jgi:hypothetical protein
VVYSWHRVSCGLAIKAVCDEDRDNARPVSDALRYTVGLRKSCGRGPERSGGRRWLAQSLNYPVFCQRWVKLTPGAKASTSRMGDTWSRVTILGAATITTPT